MKYTFRSETKTVYLNVDYKLYILSSSGTSLVNGKSTLNAVVRRISDGTEIQFDANCFTWKRHEQSESFTPITGITLEVDSSMLVNGSATFICEFSKEGLFWKDTATISITSTNQGANAPYQRTIYKVSENKPEKPGGNASELPSGWSLQPPPRVNNWKVWASVAYVTFDSGNTPIYSEWSDPVEWTGDTVLPIVQWQWGSSDTYPPDKINSIILVDGKVIVWTDDSGSAAFVDSEASVWSDTIPPKPDGRPYLWKREYNWQHTSEEDEWFYYSVTGKGLPGSYQTIGYIIVGTNSVIFAGLDEDKNPTLSTIHIFIEDMSYYFQSIEGTMNEKSDVFYLVATVNEETGIGELDFAYIDYVSTGSTSRTAWKDHLTDSEITDGFVLAEIRMNGASIKSVAIITPRRFDAYEKTRFMEILNSGKMDNINVAAEALGVERVFTAIAVLDAFISRLFANEIELTYTSGYTGSIHSSGYDKGDYQSNSSKKGFYLGADGYAELYDAILRDVTIISKDSSGNTIFDVGILHSSSTFSHYEYGEKKDLLELLTSDTGTANIGNTQYSYEIITGYYYILLEGASSVDDEWTSIAPYDCTIQFGINVILALNTVTCDVYVNGVLTIQGSAAGISSPRWNIDLEEGDEITIKYTCNYSSNIVILPISYPAEISISEQGGTYEKQAVFYKTVGNFKWPYAQISSDIEEYIWVNENVTTDISYNGTDFDDMSWYLEATSDLVTQMSNEFDDNTTYYCESNKYSYLELKGITYQINSFVIENNLIKFSTTNDVITITDDNVAKSVYLYISPGDGVIRFNSATPINSIGSTIGTPSKKFERIYCKNLYAENMDLTTDTSIHIVYRGKYAGQNFTLWSDRYIEVQDETDIDNGETKVVDYPNIASNIPLVFENDPYGYVSVQFPNGADTVISRCRISTSTDHYTLECQDANCWVTFLIQGYVTVDCYNSFMEAISS